MSTTKIILISAGVGAALAIPAYLALSWLAKHFLPTPSEVLTTIGVVGAVCLVVGLALPRGAAK